MKEVGRGKKGNCGLPITTSYNLSRYSNRKHILFFEKWALAWWCSVAIRSSVFSLYAWWSVHRSSFAFAAHVSSFVVLPHDGHVALLLAPGGLQHQETYESHELPRSPSDVRLSDCPLWKVVCSGRRSEISAWDLKRVRPVLRDQPVDLGSGCWVHRFVQGICLYLIGSAQCLGLMIAINNHLVSPWITA